jgi:hypothetical protein
VNASDSAAEEREREREDFPVPGTPHKSKSRMGIEKEEDAADMAGIELLRICRHIQRDAAHDRLVYSV